jgi:hypothetical protein
MNPRPSAICREPINLSQIARLLALSAPVCGNHPGNALGSISKAEPRAAKMRAFRRFTAAV